MYLLSNFDSNKSISIDDYNQLLSLYPDPDYIINSFKVDSSKATLLDEQNCQNIYNTLSTMYKKYCIKDSGNIKYTDLSEQF
jgi:hypothetical protein